MDEVKSNGTGISDEILKNAFNVTTDNSKAIIKAGFAVTTTMKGFFTFNLFVKDSVQHQGSVPVKVVIIG